MMKRLFLILLLVVSTQTWAQVEVTKRIETNAKEGYSIDNIYSFGSDGIVVLATSEEQENGMRTKSLALLDTELNQVKETEFSYPKQQYIRTSFVSGNDIYYVIGNSKVEGLTIKKYNSKDLSHEDFEVSFEKKTIISSMTVVGSNAYFATRLKGVQSIIVYNFDDQSKKSYPIALDEFKSKNVADPTIQVLENADEVFITVEGNTKKVSKTYILQLDESSHHVDTYEFTKGMPETNITSLTVSKIEDGLYVCTGTYGKKQGAMSIGMYFGVIEDKNLTEIKFYNFADIEGFLSYLPERQQAKIEKKKSKKESKGKEFNLDYRLATHDIIEVDGGYLLLSEAYYPTYRTETRTSTSIVNGKAVTTTTTVQVFDGYQYSHAILSKFSVDGEKEWVQTFAMGISNKPYSVKKFIRIAEMNKEEIKLVFPRSSRTVVSKSFDYEGNVTLDRKAEMLDTGKEGDMVKYGSADMEYWYDNFFVSFGSQLIKNKEEKGSQRKRYVYYINKVEYN